MRQVLTSFRDTERISLNYNRHNWKENKKKQLTPLWWNWKLKSWMSSSRSVTWRQIQPMMYLKCKKNHFILELPEHTTITHPLNCKKKVQLPQKWKQYTPPKHILHGAIPQITIWKVIKKTHKIWTSAGIKRNGWKTWLAAAHLPINKSFYCTRKCIQQWQKKCIPYMQIRNKSF